MEIERFPISRGLIAQAIADTEDPSWSTSKVDRLRVLWDEGHSTAEIGRRLGVSKNAVVGKAHRLHLPARPSPIKPGNGWPTRGWWNRWWKRIGLDERGRRLNGTHAEGCPLRPGNTAPLPRGLRECLCGLTAPRATNVLRGTPAP